jgi:hypothetical protein
MRECTILHGGMDTDGPSRALAQLHHSIIPNIKLAKLSRRLSQNKLSLSFSRYLDTGELLCRFFNRGLQPGLQLIITPPDVASHFVLPLTETVPIQSPVPLRSMWQRTSCDKRHRCKLVPPLLPNVNFKSPRVIAHEVELAGTRTTTVSARINPKSSETCSLTSAPSPSQLRPTHACSYKKQAKRFFHAE